MADGLSKKQIKKVGDSILEGLMQHAISTGRIDPSGLTAEEIRDHGIGLIQDFVAGKVKLMMITDHTGNLLARAREEARQGALELAVVYYATWAEHTLNKWITNVCGDGDGNLASMLIRETAVRAKYAWVCIATARLQPSKLQIDRLQQLSDTRNSFIHYKWKPGEIGGGRVKELKALILKAELLVNSLRKFEHVHFMKRTSRRISRMKRISPLPKQRRTA